MHERRHQVTLDPPRALPDEVAVRPIRLLVRRRADDTDGLAEGGRPDAEVGVLGDVERVPAAELSEGLGAEVVRRAAERDRQVHRFETGQHVVEPERVLEREEPGERVLLGVEVVQCGLYADAVLVAPAERDDRGLQLLGVRPVLGVVDDEELAAGEVEPDVARLRLRLRVAGRDGDERDGLRRVGGRGGLAGLVVVGFEEEEDLELLLRVVEPAEVVHEQADDVGLVVHRHEDRVERQLGVVERGDLLRRDRVDGFVARADHARDELEDDRDEEADAGGGREDDRGADRRQDERDDEPGQDHDDADPLRPVEHLVRGAVAVAAPQAEGGLLEHLVGEVPADGPADVPLARCGRDDRCAEDRSDRSQPFRRRAERGGDDDPAVRLDADGEPQLHDQPAGVDVLQQRRVDRVVGEVDERAAPHLGQHTVEVDPPHHPGRHEDAAQHRPGLALASQRPVDIFFAHQPAVHQFRAKRTGRVSARHDTHWFHYVTHDRPQPADPVADGRDSGASHR